MKKAPILKILLPVVFFFLYVQKILVLSGCANMIPPSGGPRDSLPPLMVRAAPADSTLNFNTKTIELTFDEYIELQNLQENLLISPTPENNPLVESKLRTLTVKFRDDPEPNTTYSLNFGNAIKDVNEGNTLSNFTYIFSTGAVLDSLELTGRVVLAETGGIDSTLIVMLHRNGDDSALVKEKPRYVTRLDGKGNFHFRNLPAGTFYLYALKDEGGTKRYFNTEQLFAFSDSSISVEDNSSPLTLYAFASKRNQPTATTFSFGGARGTPGRGDERRLRYGHNLANDMQDLLSDFIMNFEQSLKILDTTKISLSTDSLFHPLTQYSWVIDSSMKKLSLKISWDENTRYNLILDKDFAEDSSGRKLLKTDTLHFTTRKRSDYGSVNLRFRNLDTLNNHVLLFIQGGQVVNTFPLLNGTLFQPLFNPGEYELRILFDKNNNNRWDPGEFFGKRIQPELVIPIERRISVRSGNENEIEIEVPSSSGRTGN